MMKLMVERVMPIIYGSGCYVLSLYHLNSIGDAIIYGIPWATLINKIAIKQSNIAHGMPYIIASLIELR